MSLDNYVTRGASWSDYEPYCCSAFRSKDIPNNRFNNIGFRVIKKLNITAYHVTRGGSWFNKLERLRSAYRDRTYYHFNYIGFRVTKR